MTWLAFFVITDLDAETCPQRYNRDLISTATVHVYSTYPSGDMRNPSIALEPQQVLRFPHDALLPQLDRHPSNQEASSSAASSPNHFAIGERHFHLSACLLATICANSLADP